MRLLYSESSSYNLFERPPNMLLKSNFSEADQSVASTIGIFLKNKSSPANIVNSNYGVTSVNCDNAQQQNESTFFHELNQLMEDPNGSVPSVQSSLAKRFSKRFLSQSLSNKAFDGVEPYGIVDQAALIVGDALRSNPGTPCGSPASPAITSLTPPRNKVNDAEVNFIYVKASPKKDQDETFILTSNMSGISVRSTPSPTDTDVTVSTVFSSNKSLKRLSNGATGLLKNKLDLFVSKGSTMGDDDFYPVSQISRSKSVSYLKSKSQSAPQLEGQSFDEFLGDSCTKPSTDFDETTRIINNFNNIETLIDDIDGRKLVREFMKKRCNEELLLYLEVVRTFKKIKSAQTAKQNQQPECTENGTPVESPRVTNLITSTNATSLSFEFLRMKEFQLVHNQFISIESTHCINVDHSIRDRFTQLHKELISQEYNEITAKRLNDKFMDCLEQLYITISLQFKNEIFPQFKRTEEYKEILLRRVVEKFDGDAFYPEETLIETLLSKIDMKECSKKFKKKKLENLGQIQNFTTEDFKKIGISKLGHLKRISKAVKDHFNRSEELKRSFSSSIFQTPTTPRE